jgi:hypothetical protein
MRLRRIILSIIRVCCFFHLAYPSLLEIYKTHFHSFTYHLFIFLFFFSQKTRRIYKESILFIFNLCTRTLPAHEPPSLLKTQAHHCSRRWVWLANVMTGFLICQNQFNYIANLKLFHLELF